jgi:hypothetical protein
VQRVNLFCGAVVVSKGKIRVMPANTDHPAFQQPPNANIKVWRYMDFTKYISLLDASGLYFPRSDLLGDPFEGSTSRVNLAIRSKVYKGLSPEQVESLTKQLSNHLRWSRQWTFINSWHMNEIESAAMWSIYARSNEAISVQSTYTRLCNCLPPDVFVGEVQYINYENEWMPEGNSFWPFVHKRKSYEHEREIRAVLQDMSPSPGQQNAERGRLVEVSVDDLVEAVYVAPTAPTWFRDVVEAVTAKYGFAHKPIIRSSLDSDLVY